MVSHQFVYQLGVHARFVQTLLLDSGVLGSTVVQEEQYLFKAIEK
jgi:hypothetical protein